MTDLKKAIIEYYYSKEQNEMFQAVGTKSDKEQAEKALDIIEMRLEELTYAESRKQAVRIASKETGITSKNYMDCLEGERK